MGLGAAAIGVGAAATIGSSVLANNAQQKGDQEAISQQQSQLAQEQSNEAPYLETGSGALGQLAGLYGISTPTTAAGNASSAGFSANSGAPSAGGFTNAAGGSSTADPNASFYLSPDYNFTLTQGLKGLTASGAATNGTDNGATDKAEIAYAGNLASGQYDNYKAGLMSLAGMGGQSASNTNQSTAGTSNELADQSNNQGNQASQFLGSLGTEAGKVITSSASSFAGPAEQPVSPAQAAAISGTDNSVANKGAPSGLLG